MLCSVPKGPSNYQHFWNQIDIGKEKYIICLSKNGEGI